MAENTLNQIFKIETRIKALEIELKDLRSKEKKLITHCIESKSMENRYYRLVNKIRSGDRVVQVSLLKEKYPDIAKQVIEESVKVTVLQKYIGDEVVSELSIKKPDSITWYVEKKQSEGVIVA